MNNSAQNVTGREMEEPMVTPEGDLDLMVMEDQGKIFSDHTRYLFEVIVYICMCGFISIIGISTNIINIIVFIRQGLVTDSANTSLLGLALADLCCLATMLWLSINFAVIQTDPSEIPWDPLSVLYITAGWPHVMFTRVTCWITGFVAFERCMCVTLPFKVKTLFTPKRSLCVIVSIFSIIILTYIPIFYSHQLRWRRMPGTNVTKLVLVFTDDKDQIEHICHYINDVILPTICLTIVMVCTKITVTRINTSSNWRKSVAAGTSANITKSTVSNVQEKQKGQRSGHEDRSVPSNETELSVSGDVSNMASTNVSSQQAKKEQHKSARVLASSQKEKKVTRMITLICTIFLVCNTPCILIIYLRFMVPEIANMGRYHNLFHVLYSIDFLLETFNSTINIVVYYTMSSRYKQEFHKLFSFGCND